MRVVLVHHFPLAEDAAGHLVRQWAADLQAAGHAVRVLIVDALGPPSSAGIERVVCNAKRGAADLPFAVPHFGDFSGSAAPRQTFHQLSDAQLAAYRDQQRSRLDSIIAGFDPHVIHAQHIWIQGQLALETGVPYVLNAWGPELPAARGDERYATLAAQAAENAGRILAPNEALARQVVEQFEISAERLLVMPSDWTPGHGGNGPPSKQRGAALAELYQMVYDERFGPLG
jgi:hypothetical protein